MVKNYSSQILLSRRACGFIAPSCSDVSYCRTIHSHGTCAVVFPPKRPELRRDSARTRTCPVSSLLTASNVATTTLVRVWSFIHPCEFGADGIETGTACGMNSE